ncbi:MAG: MFS transporter [Pirellulales bacterium]|nr:MFS transporter [Pirellulales bacterium]
MALADAVEAADPRAVQVGILRADKAATAAEKVGARATADAVRQGIEASRAPNATEPTRRAADRAKSLAVEAAAAIDQQRLATGGAVVLISLLVFIASHAFGQGAVIWVFISEIFPNRVRARGQALGSFTHWVMAAAISWSFPMFAEASGGHTFAFYAVMMVGQLAWVLLIMPETKGVPLEEIQKKMGIR